MIQDYINVIKELTTIQPTSYLEIGALNIDYAVIIAKEFNLPREKIFLVEPNPYSAQQIKDSDLLCNLIELAVCEGASPSISFHCVDSSISSHVGCSSTLKRCDSFGKELIYKTVSVSRITGEGLLDVIDRKSPIYIPSFSMCVIDVEGMAHSVLKSFQQSLIRLDSFSIEVETRNIFGIDIYGNMNCVIELITQTNTFDLVYQKDVYKGQQDLIFVKKEYLK